MGHENTEIKCSSCPLGTNDPSVGMAANYAKVFCQNSRYSELSLAPVLFLIFLQCCKVLKNSPLSEISKVNISSYPVVHP